MDMLGEFGAMCKDFAKFSAALKSATANILNPKYKPTCAN